MVSLAKSMQLRKYRKYPRPALYDAIKINAQDVAGALALLLTDVYGLYFRTTDVHKILSTGNTAKYHPILDNHGQEIFFAAKLLNECIQKLGGTLHRWPVILAYLQKEMCGTPAGTLPRGLLMELSERNKALAVHMRETHWLCDEYGDSDSAMLLRECIEETDRRVIFLGQTGF